jgi:hypothetical protein
MSRVIRIVLTELHIMLLSFLFLTLSRGFIFFFFLYSAHWKSLQIWCWFPGILLASIIWVREQGQTSSSTGNYKIWQGRANFCAFYSLTNNRVSSPDSGSIKVLLSCDNLSQNVFCGPHIQVIFQTWLPPNQFSIFTFFKTLLKTQNTSWNFTK